MVVCQQLRSVRVIYFRSCARLPIDVLLFIRLLSATSVLLSLSLEIVIDAIENTYRCLDIFSSLSSLVFLQLILHHNYDDIVGTCVDHRKTTRVNLQSDLFSRVFFWLPTDRRRGISRLTNYLSFFICAMCLSWNRLTNNQKTKVIKQYELEPSSSDTWAITIVYYSQTGDEPTATILFDIRTPFG